MRIRRFATLERACLAGLLTLAPAAGADEASHGPGPSRSGVYRGASTAVRFDVSPPLRSLPPGPIGAQTRSGQEERPSGLEGPLGPQSVDPVVQALVGAGEMPSPGVSFDGPSNLASVAPPDPVGDVGPNHYVAMSNLYFAVYSKSGTLLYGPAANNTLWAGFGGPCQTENQGDPIVLYDQFADRWILTQFTASGPTYYNCMAVSTSGDPTGTYYRYAISTGANFPDYPKYGVWRDAYYISTREFTGSTFAGIGAYALNRIQMLAGNPSPQIISFLVTPASAGGASNIGDGLLPADIDGPTLPPADSPEYFLGTMDDGGPYGAPQDALTLWKFHVDFAVPANSTFTLAATTPVTAFDSMFPCSPGPRYCIPQPGTTNKVDHLGYRQRLMHRLAYRNYGTHESLVTNQSVEATTGMAGIRWYELRDPNGTPTIYQQGTYAPGASDGVHRWMGSIAMDASGNMALGYSASEGTATYPSAWYTGRLAGDALGTMPQGEGSIINGTGSQTGSQRWGDYTSMNVDPTDDCTFWYVNQYIPTTSSVGWQLRIGSFKFPTCSAPPTFTVAVTPPGQAVCAPSAADYTVNVGSISGFSNAVALSATGNPSGTTVVFSANPVTPPGSSTMTIGNTGAAAPGSYTLGVQGQSSSTIVNQGATLYVFGAAPGIPTLLTPSNGAVSQPLSPSFTWNAASGAASYTLEIATDSGFSSIVHTASGLVTTSYSGATLISNTQYYWRVRGVNPCGSGTNSAVFSFTTLSLSGDCPAGTVANVLYSQDFESGAAGWTHSGTGDTWTLSAANPHSGTQSFFATNPASVSDQRLVSPPVVLPTGNAPVTLRFWNWQHMETRTGGCNDGGILEASTDGGSVWTQIGGASLLSDPYDGPVSANFSNPLAALNAWCGNNPQPYLNSIVDISGFAGQTVRFRFRLGSDTSGEKPGWFIDDVVVRNCVSDLIFKDGFQAPAVVLLDSGSLVTHPGGGASGADASRLQNSSLGMTVLGFSHSTATAITLAEDFTVPAGPGWGLSKITFFAYQTGSTTTSTLNDVRVRLWNGPPNAGGAVIWGDLSTNRMVSTSFSNIYRDTETTVGNNQRPAMKAVASVPVSLSPGTYWVEWQTGGTLASGPFAPPITILGQTTTGNALQYNGGWGTATDVGPQGFRFIIEGVVLP